MKNKKNIIMLFLTIFFACKLCGQEISPHISFSKLGIKVGYWGEFVLHPGFTTGIDYTLYNSQRFNLHWDSELGFYFHKWNNNALFLQTSLGTRFISSFSAFMDVNAGLGYMLTSPNGDVYSVDDGGELSSKGKPYYSHLKPNISLLFGWDGTRKREIPILFQVGIEAYWQSHFNHSMLPHAAFCLEVVYRIKK